MQSNPFRSNVTFLTTAERLAKHRDAGNITEKEYEAMHFHEVKGLSYRTISLGLGLSVTAVRDRVKRGAEKIRLAESKEKETAQCRRSRC